MAKLTGKSADEYIKRARNLAYNGWQQGLKRDGKWEKREDYRAQCDEAQKKAEAKAKREIKSGKALVKGGKVITDREVAASEPKTGKRDTRRTRTHVSREGMPLIERISRLDADLKELHKREAELRAQLKAAAIELAKSA